MQTPAGAEDGEPLALADVACKSQVAACSTDAAAAGPTAGPEAGADAGVNKKRTTKKKKKKKKKKKNKGAQTNVMNAGAASSSSAAPTPAMDAVARAATVEAMNTLADEIEATGRGQLSINMAAALRSLPPEAAARFVASNELRNLATFGGQPARGPATGSDSLQQVPSVEQLRELLVESAASVAAGVPAVVQEARELCAMVAKLRFKDDSLQVRLERVMEALRQDACGGAKEPHVRIGTATNLWQFLQTAQKRVADRHAALSNSLRLSQTNAARCKTADRQRVHLKKAETLSRLIKECECDSTVFNCIAAMFVKTDIYQQLQDILDTQFSTNTRGEPVHKMQPEDAGPSFDEVLQEEKEKMLARKSRKAGKTGGSGGSSGRAGSGGRGARTRVPGGADEGTGDLFGRGSLTSMLGDLAEEEDDEEMAGEVAAANEERELNETIRRARYWGKK